MNHDYRTEYASNFSVGIQRQLTPTLALEANYLGSRITGADSSTVLNVPSPGPGPISPRRPVPELSSITAIRWDGYSIFHSITLKAEQRFSRGLTFSANYMLSKSIDDASDPGATAYEVNLPQDVRNMRAERALSSFDHRHRFTASFDYVVPTWRGLKSRALSGVVSNWRIGGIVTLQSGAPFTVNLGTDRANIGSGPAQRPNVTCNPNAGGARTAQQWFNINCFTLPDQYTFGNSGRNTVLAPGYTNFDAAIQKGIRMSERLQLELRAEMFNVLNTVNFDLPNRIAFTPNFGRIFSAAPPRQMQFAIKTIF